MSAPAPSSTGTGTERSISSISSSERRQHGPQHLSPSDLEAIKAAHPLEELATRYGLRLARSGPCFVALCPFHAEEHPSFTIFPASNSWWCFGCRRGGDAIDLVRLLEGLSFREAVAALGGDASLISRGGIAADPNAAYMQGRERRAHAERWLAARVSADGQRALAVAVACYAAELEESMAAQRYLARRGISGTLARACSLGYCSGSRLRDALRKAGVPLRAAWDVGLLAGREGTERFAGRITIPEVRAGHPVWLTGRLLDDRDDAPRYMSLPGARPLLGAEHIAGQPAVVGTEGPFDVRSVSSKPAA